MVAGSANQATLQEAMLRTRLLRSALHGAPRCCGMDNESVHTRCGMPHRVWRPGVIHPLDAVLQGDLWDLAAAAAGLPCSGALPLIQRGAAVAATAGCLLQELHQALHLQPHHWNTAVTLELHGDLLASKYACAARAAQASQQGIRWDGAAQAQVQQGSQVLQLQPLVGVFCQDQDSMLPAGSARCEGVVGGQGQRSKLVVRHGTTGTQHVGRT